MGMIPRKLTKADIRAAKIKIMLEKAEERRKAGIVADEVIKKLKSSGLIQGQGGAND